MSSNEFFLKDEKHLGEAARWFVQQMKTGGVYTFSGEMGAGKTTLIKAICKELKVGEVVSSPTFALVYEYNSPIAGTLYHFDLYRLKDISELYDLGYEDYFYGSGTCFIEWPEIAENLLPPGTNRLVITVNSDKSRHLSLKAEKLS